MALAWWSSGGYLLPEHLYSVLFFSFYTSNINFWLLDCSSGFYNLKLTSFFDFFSDVCSVVTDSCIAMDEWVHYPSAHTALDELLPCIDNATTQETLKKSKDITYQIVAVINLFISNVSNQDPSSNIGMPLNFHQSGPKVPTLCNPFNSDYSNRHCSSNEVNFSNATKVRN